MLYATSGKHISVLQEFLKNMQCKRKKKKSPPINVLAAVMTAHAISALSRLCHLDEVYKP